MELDYDTVKALSSITRIKILHRVLEKEASPTQLSTDIGKTKSTIASHLAVLESAGLVEKDKQEGRRRVTYGPTRKAKAIIEGRERTVRFSIASSVLSAVIGIGLIFDQFLLRQPSTVTMQSDSSLSAQTMAAEAAGATASSSSSILMQDVLVVAAVVLLLAISLGSFYYAWLLRPASEE